MNYYKVIINLIALIIVAVGVVMIYDARKISKKWFAKSDLNRMAKTFKGFGFLISIIGAIVVILNM